MMKGIYLIRNYPELRSAYTLAVVYMREIQTTTVSSFEFTKHARSEDHETHRKGSQWLSNGFLLIVCILLQTS
jgi:hypothetical protein